MLGIENENKMFSVNDCGIKGTAQKQSTVKIADDGKKRLNLFLDDFELSIIIESIGARTRPKADAAIPATNINPDETLK